MSISTKTIINFIYEEFCAVYDWCKRPDILEYATHKVNHLNRATVLIEILEINVYGSVSINSKNLYSRFNRLIEKIDELPDEIEGFELVKLEKFFI